MRTFEDFLNVAEAQKISVQYVNLRTLGGGWIPELRLIQLNNSLTTAQATAALAHELVHAALGHAGHQCEHVERRVDERAAHLIITPEDYEQAERLVGSNPLLIAAELDTTPRMVQAWARTWQGTCQRYA